MNQFYYCRFVGGPMDGQRKIGGGCDCCDKPAPVLANVRHADLHVDGEYRLVGRIGQVKLAGDHVVALEYRWKPGNHEEIVSRMGEA